jgi:hypothetical protein
MLKKQTASKSTGKLKKDLDSIFSKYIRLRDSNGSGCFKCITCSDIIEWKYGHNCHYWSRNILSTRYDEENCNAGCRDCNVFDKSHNTKYAIALLDKYGDKILRQLDKKRRVKIILKKVDYLEKIDYYKKEVKELATLKGIEL